MEADEAVNHFREMKKDAEDVVSKVEEFQKTAAKFIDDATESLKLTIAKGEEYLKGVQVLADSPEVQKNPLFKELVTLMADDLQKFREEGIRLEKVRKHYAEISQLYTVPTQVTP